MKVESQIVQEISSVLKNLYNYTDSVSIQPTKKEFEGTFTFVVFPLVKALKKSPADLGKEIGEALKTQSSLVEDYNVIQGFLNLSLHSVAWQQEWEAIQADEQWGQLPATGSKVMVEFSSPNTNKPLHLGHLRNNFLGSSVSEILKAAGHEVVKTCLVNDRGIHICKSMVAYEETGNNETPESSGIKGDHLAGKYYVAFDKMHKAEMAELIAQNIPEEQAAKETRILKKAQDLLLKWENADPQTIDLWKQMNEWVYEGFNQTYAKIGVSFQKTYYESETYLLGKEVVEEGLANGVFFKKEDGSVWIDLTAEKLDQKLLLRKDGTSVYITQDLGTTDLKYQDFGCDKSIWVVGNEQDYHFQVLFSIMKKLGRSYADGCYHLSYGMVDLPSGKMKSREGTVVDADDLVAEMIQTAKDRTMELGKTDGFEEQELEKLYDMLGLGALKYFLLKVDPKKRMLFNPEESIDFQGHTGPFIQYTHARIRSIVRKAGDVEKVNGQALELLPIEKDLVQLLGSFHSQIMTAAAEYAPSIMAQYVYDLAKSFNGLYQEVSILKEENAHKRAFRVALSDKIGQTIKISMGLLGISVPERM